MADQLTIQQIINIGKYSAVLARKDADTQYIVSNNNGSLNGNLWLQISIVTYFLEDRYSIEPSDTSLRMVANYLYWLCGKYALAALNSFNPGGTTVIIVIQDDRQITITYRYIQFVVGDADSVQPIGLPVMNDGDTVYVIPWSVAVDSEIIFYQGAPVARVPSNEPFYYTITYGVSVTTIVFSQPVVDNNLVMIHNWQNVTPGSGIGGIQFVIVTVVTTADTIDVPELDGHVFITAITGTQSFTTEQVTQTGTTLDFSQVGGVTAGQQITIFFE